MKLSASTQSEGILEHRHFAYSGVQLRKLEILEMKGALLTLTQTWSPSGATPRSASTLASSGSSFRVTSCSDTWLTCLQRKTGSSGTPGPLLPDNERTARSRATNQESVCNHQLHENSSATWYSYEKSAVLLFSWYLQTIECPYPEQQF
jgi:hypothetical protein